MAAVPALVSLQMRWEPRRDSEPSLDFKVDLGAREALTPGDSESVAPGEDRGRYFCRVRCSSKGGQLCSLQPFGRGDGETEALKGQRLFPRRGGCRLLSLALSTPAELCQQRRRPGSQKLSDPLPIVPRAGWKEGQDRCQ